MAYLYNKQHRPPPMNTPGKDHLGHCNQSNNCRQPGNKVLPHNLQQQRLDVTENLSPQKAELAKFSLSRQI